MKTSLINIKKMQDKYNKKNVGSILNLVTCDVGDNVCNIVFTSVETLVTICVLFTPGKSSQHSHLQDN
jgi:hypothetical protein